VLFVKWDVILSREDKDKFDIVKLQKIAFPGEAVEKCEISNWEWEYKKNFFGDSEIFVVKDKNKIVGHYAFLPQEYILHGKTVKAGHAVSAMVDPNYQRKGMYNSLQEYALANTQKTFSLGIAIRKPIMHAEIKGGYQITEKVPIFTFPVNFTGLIKSFVPIPIAPTIIGYPLTILYRLLFPNRIRNNQYLIEKVGMLSNVLGNFFNNQIKDYDIYLKKSPAYIKWRFDEIPGVEYDKFIVKEKDKKDDIVAYFVLRKERIKIGKVDANCIIIIDLEIKLKQKRLLSHIMKFIISIARKGEYDCLTFVLADDGFISKQMKFHGIVRYPFDYYRLIVHNNKDKDIATLFKQSKKIYLNFSDTDIL